MSIKIFNYNTLPKNDFERLFSRSSINYDALKTEIKPIMDEVKQEGDKAILNKYTKRKIPVTTLLVSDAEFSEAQKKVSTNFLKALATAKSNIESVCLAQRKSLEDNSKVEKNGVAVWREWRSLDTVGIYAPGGRANYPSTLLMCALPALIAGCKKIIVCAPPNPEGKLPAELLVTAKNLGIREVFKVGGVQAIAALAYGTESIPKVLKIVGPGNQYVTAAKLSIYPQTNIDMPAGPSENLIIADDTANPKFVAADLITDAEHGPDSTSILVTPSEKLAMSVQREVDLLLKTLPTKETIEQSLQNYGAIIIVESIEEAISVSNEYAPEHMQIMTSNPSIVLKSICNAGSVFLGPYSAKAAGDYCSGANHVLPTGQAAKTFGPLAVDSFGKWLEVQKISEVGLKKLSKTIETYAEVEDLPAHKLSSLIRKKL
ncbi:histidinol dehydrogenase [Candidatus Woesebacteria bacterium]|nr:histidinol dehydrogenase [Candidatus Woesebacteria bacterium]